MIFDNQLRYALNIVSTYKGEAPLHAWLKNFFREHKQMGSRDRKVVGTMVYGFYRLGHAAKNISAAERILAALFLCQEAPMELLNYFRPDWDARTGLRLEEKIALYRQSNPEFEPTDIFPWKEELSEGVDHHAFCLSFLRQPDLFLRIRPGFQGEVLHKLAQHFGAAGQTSAPSAYEFIPPFTVRLPNGFKVEELFTPDKEVVIQDYSSQRIAPFLQASPAAANPAGPRPLAVWDACAASGGKSILAYDGNPQINLTVSDIRDSILHNLRQRFRQAGITKYHSFTADLTGTGAIKFPGGAPRKDFDLIIVDAPCSGSGTWSRTPEELYFFDPRKIGYYSEIQRKITARLLPYLAKGGSLVYITCSVFKKENEDVAAAVLHSYLGAQAGANIHPDRVELPDRMELIKGYDLRADSMFAARFNYDPLV
jgi:16S rRNA (cytosine967-C5)-methyltransferase